MLFEPLIEDSVLFLLDKQGCYSSHLATDLKLRKSDPIS